MTIRHMNIFIAVYRAGNMTHAAEQLHMTQPAVTRAIKELEQYYGVLLFERINQRLSVTEAGHQFYAYALHIIDSYDIMEKEMRNWDELGIIRIGASVTLGSDLLPKAIKDFQKEHPNLTVKATVANGTKLQAMLENNELDFAMIEGNVSSENLMTEEFLTDRLILLLPPDCPLLDKEQLDLKDLESYPMIAGEKESISRILIDSIFSLHHLKISPLMESASTHAIVQSVHEGLGFSFLPERLVSHSVESGFIASRPVTGESFVRKNYIVYHKNKLLTASAREFITLSKALLSDLIESGK